MKNSPLAQDALLLAVGVVRPWKTIFHVRDTNSYFSMTISELSNKLQFYLMTQIFPYPEPLTVFKRQK